MNLDDDAAFELPTVNLVRPDSIPKLEWEVDNAAQPAQEMVQDEIDHAVIDPNLQPAQEMVQEENDHAVIDPNLQPAQEMVQEENDHAVIDPNLQPAQEMVQEENDHAVIDPNLQPAQEMVQEENDHAVIDPNLQPAQEMVQEENDHAVIDPNLQREQSPGPPELTDDIFSTILALAEDLGEFREVMRYRFCRDSGSDNEPALVDDSDDKNEGDEDAVEVVGGEYQGRLDQ